MVGLTLILPACGGEPATADATSQPATSQPATSQPATPQPATALSPPEARRRSPSPEDLANFKQSVERGVNFLNSGEYAKAAAALSVAVAIQPENTVVLRYLGSAYARDNELERARRVLQVAIDLVPTDPAAHYEMAQVALAAGDLDGAERESKKTAELDPSNLRAQELVGIVQYRQGTLELAAATLEPLVVDGGIRPDSAYTLGLCYQGLERYEEARDIFRMVVKGKPDYAQAWFNLGKVLSNLGDEQGAVLANEKFEGLGGKIPGEN